MRAALIGAGQIARQHLACLATLPNVEIAGICDLSAATAEAAAERYGVGAWFTDHRAMLDKVRPDIVHITTPPTSHFRLAQDAIGGNAHVIVEKPATSTLDELEKLETQARQSGRHLIEDYNYVFNRAPQRILELIDAGKFGKVTHVEVLICLDIFGPGGLPTRTRRTLPSISQAAPLAISCRILPRWRIVLSALTAPRCPSGPSEGIPSCRMMSSTQ